jgi:hypothetical protein
MDKVKWQDDAGGWHTGTLVPDPNGGLLQVGRQTLVKESCCGTLTWVHLGKLADWESREKWEKPPVSFDGRPWYFDQPSFTESKQ